VVYCMLASGAATGMAGGRWQREASSCEKEARVLVPVLVLVQNRRGSWRVPGMSLGEATLRSRGLEGSALAPKSLSAEGNVFVDRSSVMLCGALWCSVDSNSP